MLHENRWQGPAIVIGQDNKIVIVKHGNIIRRVHPCNLRLKTPKEIIGGTENEIGSKATSLNTENNQQNITIATNKLENNDDEQLIPDENVDDVPKRVESNPTVTLKISQNKVEIELSQYLYRSAMKMLCIVILMKTNGKQLTY